MMRRRILPLTKSIRRDIRIVTHFAWCPERHMAYALSYCGARYELAIYVAPCMNEPHDARAFNLLPWTQSKRHHDHAMVRRAFVRAIEVHS
jgi:hypothetical protein